MPTSRIAPELIERSFGLVAMVENTRVLLPLKAVECEFSVVAGMVEVRMTQVFRQENPKPLDCDYLFPLPADASVYLCEADFNGRIIRAIVKERGEAVRLAEEKKLEGRRVALVESERENLFTLSLKNLQPEDLVLMTLKYVQPLRYLAGRPSVEIPFCPGIRYIPGNPLIRTNRGSGTEDDTNEVPDASRISPVRMEKEHPDAAFVDLRGKIDGKFVEAISIESPSHNVISRPAGDIVEIRLSDKGEVPDRDFVLRWQETKTDQLTVRAWMQVVGEETYALMEIRAPRGTGAAAPMDFYFLLDHSGSMAGVKWQKAALAVKTCLSMLTEKDRVALSLFNNAVRDYAEKPLPPDSLLADANFQRLEQNVANGGTQLGIALQHVLKLAAAHSQGRQKTLILITDAQVGNDTTILNIMESAPDFPVHCFGIDLALNDALLLALARQQQGTFHSLNPADDVVKVVTDLAATIRHPVLRELRLADGWEPSVRCLPPLFSEQVFHLSVRGNAGLPLSLSAMNDGTESMDLAMASQSATGNAPGLHWCKNRIQSLVAAGDRSAAIALSVRSNLICPLTAFIAWDESEKVAVASHSLAQPVMGKMNVARMLHRSPPIEDERAGEVSGMVAEFAENLSSCLEDNELYSIKQEPLDQVVREIAGRSRRKRGALTAAPFPDVEVRRRALQHEFQVINLAALAGDLAQIWKRIENWAFDSKDRMLARTEVAAGLLLELTTKAHLCLLARQQLFGALAKLNNQAHLKLVLGIMMGHTGTETEFRKKIEAVLGGHVDQLLVENYLGPAGEIRRRLEEFMKVNAIAEKS